MSEAIRLAAVSKTYRLYRSPLYKFLDLLGISPASRGYYGEHQALRDVTLSVGRGEKVAIIGRNGAGKSTMLKVITGLVTPTSGQVQVIGRISNLLQIGSGFHPDFTGRQNVFASLAHQGIVGRAASSLFDEIVAFAEIEEYIDQPMKTYSTGMCSRLMFSSAIVMAPEILIVDEILGVGDAYFSHKSFERMRDLCAHERTTLLLVTHDLYSAVNLCDRFVWLDRGAVMFDGDAKSAIAMYETSIKDQEEQRLRHANAERLAADASAPTERSTVHVLVRSRTGFALDAPLAIELIELIRADGSHDTLPVAQGADAWSLLPESSLAAAERVEGRPARVLRATGSIFHKAEWIVAANGAAAVTAARVRWRYAGRDPVDLVVFTPDRRVLVGAELEAGAGWQEARFESGAAHETAPIATQKQLDYGTGAVRVESVRFLDRAGRDVVQVRHGEPLIIRLNVRIDPALQDRRVTLVVGFSRHGSAYSGTICDPERILPDDRDCVIDVTLDPVRFGAGEWFVSLGVGAPGIYDRRSVRYFATDPDWYHFLSGRLQLRIDSPGGAESVGCFVVHPATITCTAAAERAAS